MFTTTKALLALVSCALLAQAQSTTSGAASSVPTPDSCIIGCATSAVQGTNCTSYTDFACVCVSSAFQSAAAACISTNCPSSDLTIAQQLQTAECANVTSSATASGATSTGTTATSSSTSSSASSASTSKSSGALALAAPFSFDTLVGTLAVSAGALVGAAFVL